MLDVEDVRSIPNGLRSGVYDGILKDVFHNKYCRKCGLYARAVNPYIEGRGRKDSSLLILGESPGTEEDKRGILFFQGTLNKMILDNDIQCYITDAVKCRSTDTKGKRKKSTPTQVKCCLF